MVSRGRRPAPAGSSRSTGPRILSVFRVRTFAWCVLVLALVLLQDFRPDPVAVAIAPYQFSILNWELANLPDKWTRRLAKPFSGSTDPQSEAANIHRYFEIGVDIRDIDWQLITLEVQPPDNQPVAEQLAELRRQREILAHEQSDLRPDIENVLESVLADTLQELGFKAWTGVFPPVDTVLTGSPTVLIMSPRDRIERIEGALLRTGLDLDQRERIETRVEGETGQSALVANTGGIALYPSITANNVSLEHAVEIIAHEWVHQWLWFRPLGRRYFDSPDLTTLNETVATIAGEEIGQLALMRITGPPDHQSPFAYQPPAHDHSQDDADAIPPENRFDFQAEMRATRVRADALLEAGDIASAEAYMEERRRLFVSEGYPIRKLNQAYFAFHGSYATTGAAGVSVIGEQVQELRRQSPTLTEFLRAAAALTGPEDLARLVQQGTP